MSIAFIVTALIIVVTPGTGAIYTISAGLSRGARASVVAAFGCMLGTVPHLTAAVTGTAALLRARCLPVTGCSPPQYADIWSIGQRS